MDEFNNDVNITPENEPSKTETPENENTPVVTPETAPEAHDAAPAEPEEKPAPHFVPPYATYMETIHAENAQAIPESPAGNETPGQTAEEAAHTAQKTPAPEPVHAEETGEYRYVPPHSSGEYRIPYSSAEPQKTASNPASAPSGVVYTAGNAGAAPVMVQPAADKKEKKKKAKKEKKGFSAGAVALLLVSCILLSFAAGIGGALLYNKFAPDAGNGSLVIYKSPDKDKDTDKDAPDVNPTLPDSGDTLSVSDVCALVADSVVEIDTEFKNTYGFYQYVSDGAGSGVIISADGYVITNNHVIFNSETNKVADTVTVRLADGTEYEAEIIGRDADADIALLKVEAKDLSPAVVGKSASLKTGETVLAVGNPLGELGGTVTCGIVSATNREITVDSNKMNLIQIDAAVNPGNSGGGIFNMKGELVGIVNAKSSGSDVDGLGFAIPVDDAISVVEELKNHGYVTGKTYIGVSLIDVTDMYTAYYYFRSQQPGVYVAQVQEGFNDDVLKYGDRIIAIGDTEITSTEDVKSAVKEHKVGDVLKFTISRDGKFMTVDVKCCEYVPEKDVTFTEDKAGK